MNKKTKTGDGRARGHGVEDFELCGEIVAVRGVGSRAGEKEEIKEETRLEHRVLDLRRPQMARNLKLRHDTLRALRKVMEDDYGFFRGRKRRC